MSAFHMFGGDSLSVMASGDWYKITVDRDGIYRITFSELVGLGITDPANVRIYGSGGAMLSEKANENSGNDLQEIPIWMYTGNDGVFNSGDYILFYGQGPALWQYNKEKQTFEHSIHLWDNQSCYFITSRAGGKRITTETPPSASPSQTVTSFDERQYYEAEQMNLIKSGRYWYGEDFRSATTTYQFPFTVPDVETGAAWMNISFMAQTPSSAAHLAVKCNGRQVADQPLPVSSDYQVATATTFNTSTFNPASSNLSVELTVNRNGVGNSGGWLDYIRLFARRKLNMASSQLFFRDTQSVGAGGTSRFLVTGSSTNTQVWDITDRYNIRRMDASLSGSTLSFSAATDALREFVAFDITSGLLKPAFPEKNTRIDNQNLHGMENVDMVIVTHPNFMDAAQELAALHYSRDGMTVNVVTAEQVYNEFSSGMQDPAAIRNFMKHLFEKPAAIKLKYLLLLGDGSYDNKSNQMKEGRATANTNFIVTYQSVNSWHSTNSFVSDDYFGVLGDDEAVETGKLAIGVGRIPVQTASQARDAVDKIRRYIDAQLSGDWPNLMGLLADDEDGNLHMTQSETLANYVATNHPQYTIEKLYFDAFPQTVTIDGHRYPEVEQGLNNLLNKGCLLVNYIGHGNESGLSAERVVNTTNIGQWKNKLYPLFVVATCEFGRYDNDTRVTAGESALLSSTGGGIAVLTSTRLVYSSLNFEFNQRFFHELLHRPAEGDDHRLGDVLRRAKNASGSSVNKLCFTLLGDPALKPVIPTDSVRTVSINGKLAGEPLDTLKANSSVTVKGCITGTDGRVLTGFNGIVHFSLFDKAHESKTLNNDGDAVPIAFRTQTSTLYKGKTAVENGEFELSFIMPRDINYQYGFGKISYYACSDHGEAAAGAFEKITVGGSVPGVDDADGPKIRLFMNDTQFRDGGITDQNPKLIAYLQDEHGINTSDEGIGHNITAALSNNPAAVYILNSYYEADLGSHNKGMVNYRFTNLPVGNYELLFTAWDLENNPSQASIRFRVTRSSTLQIDKLYNYPNPFTDNTRIYFEFNMPDTELQVELQVYDMSGRLLRSMKQS
ncbi:MAG: type IX secretion system sortase PorU, partial [Bacteroidales bacterium]|nr:type IX secretion system sortase PorU [Bacteroidales bacterium]